jgi:hypothetical protein
MRDCLDEPELRSQSCHTQHREPLITTSLITTSLSTPLRTQNSGLLQSLLYQERNKINHTARVRPLVVVPREDFDQAAADDVGVLGIEH